MTTLTKENPSGNRGAIKVNRCPTLSQSPPTVNPPTCWKTMPGWVLIQVHDPESAQKLKRVHGVEQVGQEFQSRYLRLFSAQWPLKRAEDYIHRLTITNERFWEPEAPQSDSVSVDDTEEGKQP